MPHLSLPLPLVYSRLKAFLKENTSHFSLKKKNPFRKLETWQWQFWFTVWTPAPPYTDLKLTAFRSNSSRRQAITRRWLSRSFPTPCNLYRAPSQCGVSSLRAWLTQLWCFRTQANVSAIIGENWRYILFNYYYNITSLKFHASSGIQTCVLCLGTSTRHQLGNRAQGRFQEYFKKYFAFTFHLPITPHHHPCLQHNSSVTLRRIQTRQIPKIGA